MCMYMLFVHTCYIYNKFVQYVNAYINNCIYLLYLYMTEKKIKYTGYRL